MSHRNPDARQPPETTISVFEDYVKHLQQEKQTMEIQQQQLKKLLLYEKWRIQEQKQTDKLHRDAERVALQNTLLRNRHESLENEKKMQTEKLNRALYQNVEMTGWPSTNNQFRVPSAYPVNSSIQIQNLKKQVADIKSTNEALRESIDKLQKELENIQTPGKKRSLEDLDRMIMSIRESNKALELKIQYTQINNTWFENQNQHLQSDIELCRHKTKFLEEQNKTLQQRKHSKNKDGSRSRPLESHHAGSTGDSHEDTGDRKSVKPEYHVNTNLYKQKQRQEITDFINFAKTNGPPPVYNYKKTEWAKKLLKISELNKAEITKAFKRVVLSAHPDKADQATDMDDNTKSDLQIIFPWVIAAKDHLLNLLPKETSSRFGVSSFTTSGLSGVAEKHARNRYTVKEENSHLGASSKFTPYKNT